MAEWTQEMEDAVGTLAVHTVMTRRVNMSMLHEHGYPRIMESVKLLHHVTQVLEVTDTTMMQGKQLGDVIDYVRDVLRYGMTLDKQSEEYLRVVKAYASVEADNWPYFKELAEALDIRNTVMNDCVRTLQLRQYRSK